MTPFSEVYKMFLTTVTDPYFVDEHGQIKEEDLKEILLAALPEFPYPKQNINDYDAAAGQFNVTLSYLEINILALLMKKKWIERQMADINLVRQRFSERDFELTSQAAHMQALVKLSTTIKEDLKNQLNYYHNQTNNVPDFSGMAGGVK